jgi:hypothetical protein
MIMPTDSETIATEPDSPSLAGINTADLTSLFEAGRMPPGDFKHRDHVGVGWELLNRYPLGLALHHMTDGVRTLARQRGLSDLYHATITTFYMLDIADCHGRLPGSRDFAAFSASHPILLVDSREFLLGYYTPETLDSARARDEFVLPERLPAKGLEELRSSS